MASVQQIKRRIVSVKNTKQITKAMQLVAASKLRRAQEAAEKPRLYAQISRDLLTALKQLTAPNAHGFFNDRPIKHRTLIIVSSDRGLAGAYNSNVLKAMIEQIRQDQSSGIKISLVLVGRKAAQFAARLRDVEILGAYQDIAEDDHRNQLRALIISAFAAFNQQETDAVNLIYTHFISTISQQVKNELLLPIKIDSQQTTPRPVSFEPSSEEVLNYTVVRLVEAQVLQAMLEGFASEHSMRMLAMKNATDNASGLADDLTLVYNNARQAGITQELAEITGGAEALK